MGYPLLVFVLPALVLSCTPPREAPPPASAEMAVAAGQGLAGAAFRTLSSNLTGSIEQKGIQHALGFCHAEAIPLTAGVAERFDVEIEIRRASHKPRNPQNRADEGERRVIETYLDGMAAGAGPAPVILRTDGRIRYHAPIVITTPLCMQCHGSRGTDIGVENYRVIRSLYPSDEATGFGMGDLRGIWSITFPDDSAAVQGIIDMLE